MLVLRLIPPHPSGGGEGLGEQLHREACYAALGVGAWAFSQSLPFSRLLHAVASEANAVDAANPLLAPQLQARLCWLLSCWWAFGSEEESDESCCLASYSLLARMLHGADVFVQLQVPVGMSVRVQVRLRQR